ncbi:MAG: MoxR family ATPase [Planctomycetes bacterium]|nr:MoxR family ATPase [Planctomycetota bacterium]
MTESDPLLQGAAAAHEKSRQFRDVIQRLRDEIHRVVVGQDAVVDGVLAALFCDGHALLEGVPGLAKTLLVHTLADALELEFSRIQFTPDLMPADIVGTMVLHEVKGGGHELRFEQGPLVANFILADEINRATPKTQSALLEAMQERTISVARQTRPLPRPFVVLATQNPIEQEGTYPLPEAQLDRFLLKLLVDYPAEEEYREILARTTGEEMPAARRVASAEEILALRRILRQVPVSTQVETYAIRLMMATQPGSPYAPGIVTEHVSLGSSPRGAQGLLLMGKFHALCDGRFAVACEDVRRAAPDVLRHRVLLNFQGQARRIRPDDIVAAAVEAVPELSTVGS